MGSGLSAGDAKYTYEKFRSDLQTGSGYLQNEALVFNAGGAPDCFVDNLTTGTTLAFFRQKVDFDETEGLSDSQFAAVDYNGFYWTWLTMVRYIHEYFIDPYNTVLAPVNLDAGDLSDLKAIDQDLRQPINFSLEGYNPLMAIDTLVASIPGRWYWYMEYASSDSTIRIRELAELPPDEVALTICPLSSPPDCLIDSDANVTNFTVKRDGQAAVANVVGLGGKLKLITTVKLVPTWPRYQGNTSDFKSDDDFKKWKKWALEEYRLEKDGQIQDNVKLNKEEEARYPLIYRVYGLPMEGELFGDRIVSEDLAVEEDIIELTGDVAPHYSAFTIPGGGGGATFRDYFFQNAQIEREVSAPEFERYSDKVQVFMHDDLFTHEVTDKDGTVVFKEARVNALVNKPTNAELLAMQRARRWIIPEVDKISYNFDQKNMMVVFDQPQCKQKNAFELSNKERLAKTIKERSQTQMVTRDVYMTATFATDLAAVFGSRVTDGFVETINGAPFSAYVMARNQDIIYHANAWYPITQLNKDALNPPDSLDLCDGHQLGTSILKCNSFDNYREYVGEGHFELARAILNWKEGYLTYREDITADLPYMELDNDLGDGLRGIANSGYVAIASYLLGITWKRAGDSDSMLTSYTFNNYYGTDRKNIDFAPLKLDENKKRYNKRTKFKFVNEVPSGDLPPL